MQATNAQDIWEEELKQELFRTNAELRSRRIFDAGPARVSREKAEEMGIDPERVGRIVSAAEHDIDWHIAINDMVRHGMTQDHAAEVLEKIVVRMDVKRIAEDMPYEESRERKALFWSITGLVAIPLLIAVAIYYWSSLSYLATGLKVCAGLWLGA